MQVGNIQNQSNFVPLQSQSTKSSKATSTFVSSVVDKISESSFSVLKKERTNQSKKGWARRPKCQGVIFATKAKTSIAVKRQEQIEAKAVKINIMKQQPAEIFVAKENNSKNIQQNTSIHSQVVEIIEDSVIWPEGTTTHEYLSTEEQNGELKEYYKLRFNGGDTYVGTIVTGNGRSRFGVGKRIFSRGGYYEGEWSHNQYHGKGLLVSFLKNGSFIGDWNGSFIGDWKCNHGKEGAAVFSNGDIFIGNVDGDGIFIAGNTMRVGEWKGGKPFRTETFELPESEDNQITVASFLNQEGIPLINEQSSQSDRERLQKAADAFNNLRNTSVHSPENRIEIRMKAREELEKTFGSDFAMLFFRSYDDKGRHNEPMGYEYISFLANMAMQKSASNERLNQSRALRALLLHYCHGENRDARSLALDQFWCSLLFPCGYATPYESGPAERDSRALFGGGASFEIHLIPPEREASRHVVVETRPSNLISEFNFFARECRFEKQRERMFENLGLSKSTRLLLQEGGSSRREGISWIDFDEELDVFEKKWRLMIVY